MKAALLTVGIVTVAILIYSLLAPLVLPGLARLKGHFIAASIVGHRLMLNPLTVFLSLVFGLGRGVPSAHFWQSVGVGEARGTSLRR